MPYMLRCYKPSLITAKHPPLRQQIHFRAVIHLFIQDIEPILVFVSNLRVPKTKVDLQTVNKTLLRPHISLIVHQIVA